jgi:hypothetical protein
MQEAVKRYAEEVHRTAGIPLHIRTTPPSARPPTSPRAWSRWPCRGPSSSPPRRFSSRKAMSW